MQCSWCGKTYANGYGGGYCSRRCYEEGHRRICKGRGRSFTGSGYSGSGIVWGTGGTWCSEACYRKNATPAQKKVDAATAKLIWTVFLACVCPPLLLLLYWKQTWVVIRFLFRVVFSKFFWKYVVPVGAVTIAVITYMVKREKAKVCEAEMAQYAESVNAEMQKKLEEMKNRRAMALEETGRRRLEDAQKRAAEAALQKAELGAAIEAARTEQRREREVGDIHAFANKRFPERTERLRALDLEIQKLESGLKQYEGTVKIGATDLESDETYAKLLVQRNALILERRTIEQEIASGYRAQEKEAARE